MREEFKRAEALQNDKRAGTVGFALTILQRRLASSPEAIYQSFRRRRERLESQSRELEVLHRGGLSAPILDSTTATLDPDAVEDLDDLEDAPENEVAAVEQQILDQATARACAVIMDIERAWASSRPIESSKGSAMTSTAEFLVPALAAGSVSPGGR